MITDIFKDYKITLASMSPRRRQLLAEMGIQFHTCSTDVDETFPKDKQPWEVALYLSKKKSLAFDDIEIAKNEIIITADTLVSLNGSIIPKPNNSDEAIQYLKLLSGNMHYVFTGVTLRSKMRSVSFLSETKVWFRKLLEKEITDYVSGYKPYDKAGAYGIQEWIGYIGIERIEGSFYNVMGLPTVMLYSKLTEFIGEIETQNSGQSDSH